MIRFTSILYINLFGVSAGKRDQILFFFKNKFICKIDVDLIIWFRTSVIFKKTFFVDLVPFLSTSSIYLFGPNQFADETLIGFQLLIIHLLNCKQNEDNS